MQLALDILVILLLAAGCFFSLTAAVGMLRFPDFYARSHAWGINDSFSVVLFGAAMLVECIRAEHSYLIWGRILLMIGFIFMSGPAAAHAIAQAALLDGIQPWTRKDKP
ncbi:MAG: monovalent cation/H(+) antiporter subunit G [Planctomycetes bacterium]|nr:monovalent cation/H(+) antiporter subunit G [Planctomycetota bacterium]